jgi:hypothetical protein
MAAGVDPPLPAVALADIVKLKVPYQPLRGQDKQCGPFGFGIVAELLMVLPDGQVRNASLYLFDPDRRELFLGPNNIPEFVDCHGSEFELYKRADEMGYIPLLPPRRTPGTNGERNEFDGT